MVDVRSGGELLDEFCPGERLFRIDRELQ
jgi:hypothetical protein